MKEIDFNENAREILDNLRKGALLTAAANGKVNTMTIGWGSIGIMWRRPVFTVMVRKSRFTHGLIEKSGEFTVMIPSADNMSETIKFLGTISGRDMDKLAKCGLKTQVGQKVKTPVLQCRGTHFECKVLYVHDMTPEKLGSDIKNLYMNDDYHTMYFGEILASYIT